MTKHDYLRLADDGCPNCFTEWHWSIAKRPELPLSQAARRAVANPFTGFGIRGPRRQLYFLSGHVIEQWLERFGQTESDLIHAVRFSRVIGVATKDLYRALWYEPDAAFFIAGSKSNCFTVMTCVPSWSLRKPRDIELVGQYRTKCQRRAA